MDHSPSTILNYARAFFTALRDDLSIYALVASYAAVGYLFVAGVDQSLFAILADYSRVWAINFLLVVPFCFGVFALTRTVIRIDKRRNLVFRALIKPKRVGRFLAGTVLMVTASLLFSSMFSTIKTGFPLGDGFQFDVAQANIDKAIHFGVDPWRYLYAFAENVWVLRLIELNYNVFWFIFTYFTLYWVVTSPRTSPLRVRYVLTWFLSWIIIGSVMASTWLSAGPAFYGFVTGDTARFGEQMAFLASTAGEPNSAFNFQAYLWHLYDSGQTGIGSGISAFPSMHVGVVTVNALFISEMSRRLAPYVWAYLAFTMMSSVYLGWHYAIDGYVSVITVTAIYWALRKLMPEFARLRWRASGQAAEGVVQNS